jgi:uncharacterized Ntn-hydrolase superfamily protein
MMTLTRRQLLQAIAILGTSYFFDGRPKQKVLTTMYPFSELAMTYSITALDRQTGEIGVAVQTHQMGVGRLVPWVKPGVGAVATQSMVNISYGPRGLEMLERGLSPQDAINELTRTDEGFFHRQVGIIAANGQAASFTGEHCIAHAGHYVGDGYSVQANMMTNPTVIDAMREAYENSDGDLAQRMLAALEAAEGEEGDIRGMQSAALVVAPPAGENTPSWATLYDLRIDEHETPLVELARLTRLRRADLISNAGNAALQSGNRDEALQLWAEAREMAPELEELAFWQAITLTDAGNDITGAAEIFTPVFADDPLRDRWVDLIQRLDDAKLINREGAAAALIAALGS